METEGKYTMRAVARITGLSPDTIRAWERRYGAVAPARSGASHRLYSDQDVERLGLLRRAVDKGHGIGRVARLPLEDLRALGQSVEPAPPAAGDALTGILEAVRRYDYMAADRELARVASLLPPRQLVREVAHPLMFQVGELWAAGQLEVGQEHLVSALVRTLLGTLLRLTSPGGERRSPVVLAALEGEHHELGLLMAALIATSRGIPVCYLGPDSPVEEVAKVARATGAAAVGISLIHVPDPRAIASNLATLEGALGRDQDLWLGGAGLERIAPPDLPLRARRTQTLEALDEAIDALRR